MVKPTDEQLVKKYLRGDHDSFSELRSRHLNYVKNLAMHFRYQGDIDDLQQEVWMRVAAKVKKWRRQCAFTTWLNCIARTVIFMEYRATTGSTRDCRKTFSLDAYLEGEGADVNPALARPDPSLESVTGLADFDYAFEKLRPNYKQILKLRGDGYDYKEISKMTNKGVPCLKTTVLRARQAFNKNMELAQL